jgi:hypothetical protein
MGIDRIHRELTAEENPRISDIMRGVQKVADAALRRPDSAARCPYQVTPDGGTRRH